MTINQFKSTLNLAQIYSIKGGNQSDATATNRSAITAITSSTVQNLARKAAATICRAVANHLDPQGGLCSSCGGSVQ